MGRPRHATGARRAARRGARRSSTRAAHSSSSESEELAAQIERVKAEPAACGATPSCRSCSPAQKAKTDELERVAAELRGRASLLGGARRKLIADCDRALATSAARGAGASSWRACARRRRRCWRMPTQPLGVGARAPTSIRSTVRASCRRRPTCLRDSGDKLRREVVRLAARIDDVERRRHLRERAGAVDEDLFGEAVSNRQSPRVASTTFGSNHGSGDAQRRQPRDRGGGADRRRRRRRRLGGGAPAAPTPPAPAAAAPPAAATARRGGSTTAAAAPAATPAPHGGDTTVLRNLVDPATLDELRRADGGDDLERQLRALRRAQGELNGLADELDRRAHALVATRRRAQAQEVVKLDACSRSPRWRSSASA